MEFYLGERGGRSVSRHQVVLRDDGNFFTETTDQISAGNGDRFPATLVDSDWAIREAVSELANFVSGIFTATTFAEAVRHEGGDGAGRDT